MTLLTTTTSRLDANDTKLKKFRISLVHTKRTSTLNKTYQELSQYLIELGYKGLPDSNKEHMLARLNRARDRNIYLGYAAKDQAIISLCVIFEDYINRIVMKFYEEDIRRLSSNGSVKVIRIVEAITSGENLHRSLARKATREAMEGGIEQWCDFLCKHLKLDIYAPKEITKLFLIRNCVVHNNHRVSETLYFNFPDDYRVGEVVSLDLDEIKKYKDTMFSLAWKIAGEYDRAHPRNKGSWLEHSA
jgi:hypothetical protein